MKPLVLVILLFLSLLSLPVFAQEQQVVVPYTPADRDRAIKVTFLLGIRNFDHLVCIYAWLHDLGSAHNYATNFITGIKSRRKQSKFNSDASRISKKTYRSGRNSKNSRNFIIASKSICQV